MELVRKRLWEDTMPSAGRRKRRRDGPAAQSTSRPRSHKFATFLLKDPGVRHQLSSYLGPKDWFSLSQASKALKVPLQAERWDMNKRLRRWVSDPIEFRRQMGRSGAILTGDVAYDFFAGTSTNSNKRSFSIVASGAQDMLGYLKAREGYTEVKPTKSWGSWHLNRNSSDYGKVTIFLETADFPLLTIFHSHQITTGSLNFIDCNKAYSIFPYATFVKHKMYALRALDTEFTNFLRDYEGLGWGTEDVVRPVSVAGESQAPILLESMRMPRVVGDKHTWTMKLDSLDISSSYPTSTLECCEFKVCTDRNVQFFEFKQEVLQHPLLTHRYTFVRHDWKQAVVTRLNDMLVMELAKLGPKDKRSKRYINRPIYSPYSMRGLELTQAGKNFALLGRKLYVAESKGLAKKDHMMARWQKQLYGKRPYYDEHDTRFFYFK